MTLDEYRRYARYWERHPPLHLLVAACLGIRSKAAATSSDNLGELLALAPGGTLTLAAPSAARKG